MDMYKEIEYRDYRIKIFADFDPLNPREEFENVGKIMSFSKHYNLADYKHSSDIETALRDILNEEQLKLVEDVEDLTLAQLFEYVSKCNVILPIYMYSHSGITIATTPFGCRWDSGKIGWIWTPITEGMDVEETKKRLKNEIKVYDQYLTGEVYGYVIESPNGDEIDDSCWGFFGDPETSGLLKEAKTDIDAHLARQYPLLAQAGLLDEEKVCKT